MPSPERKAAERISERIFPLASCDKQRQEELIAAIIAEEHAPMRALMERMRGVISMQKRHHGCARCSICYNAVDVLADYTDMKKEEAADDHD